MSEPMNWYPSKVDWWLAPILCLPPMAAVTVCVIAAVTGSMPTMLVGLAVLALVICLYAGLVIPIRYGMDGSQLVVRFGLCRQRIALADIREVHPTNNPLSSPALSLDRLAVRFGEGIFKTVMISPAERGRFLDELAGKAGLKREGDRLLRA